MSQDAWIIEYHSPTYRSSIFFIWYTDNDENSTDKLLTFKSGEIFATHSLSDIKANILEHFDQINKFDRVGNWLDALTQSAPETTLYDLDNIYKCLSAEDYNVDVLEHLVNFINLYGDYRYQDERNQYLQTFRDNQFVDEAWEYYYNYIFWPRFNDKEKFEAWDRPPLEIDSKGLLEGVEQLIKHFEKNIRIVKC